MLLTSASNTHHFAAGYYDDFVVTSEIPDIPGTLSYTYHHHTLGEIGDADNDSSEVGLYNDDSIVDECAGCFTRPYYYIPGYSKGNYCSCTNKYTTEEDGITRCSHCGHGPHAGRTCGKSLGTITVRAHWSFENEGNKADLSKTRYARSCGKSEGMIASVTIEY